MTGSNQHITDFLAKEGIVAFRDQLRDARAHAINDAEGYQELLFALERLGSMLVKKIGTLGDYGGNVLKMASLSPLAKEIPKKHTEFHSSSPHLYELIMTARNDALHQGAFARHLAAHAIQLEIVLEDALMSDARTVCDFMVRNPVCAEVWQPISFIRQQMLSNSFSYLPVLRDAKWHLLSDQSLAQYLRVNSEARKQRLALTLDEAIVQNGLTPILARCFNAEDEVSHVMSSFQGHPILVTRRENQQDLIGILTAFDLL